MRLLICFGLLRLVESQSLYITDLPGFSSLVPCAASGISYAVQSLTYSKCPIDAVALQSCACTKDSNSAALVATVGSQVRGYCASTASDDVTSAQSVLNAYCNPGAATTPPAAKPSGGVSQYITEIAQFTDLAPCAQSGISYAVQAFSNSLCPADAAGLQSCACTKNQNSLAASQSINSQVGGYCGSTRSADKASAQAMFAGYCGLGNGTSVFPTPSFLPGVVTYYMTDLPNYSSMAPCAKSAMSYEMNSLINSLCPADPRAVVSCACAQDNNSGAFSAALVTEVKGDCGSTASADVSSALGVFDVYCSAGKGLVTPQGVTASVTPSADTRIGGAATGTKPTAGPGATSTGGSGSSSSGGSSSGGSASTTTKSRIPIAPIIGGVVGGIALIIAGLLALCCYRRRRRFAPPVPPMQPTPDTSNFGKFELANNQSNNNYSRAPVMRKEIPTSVQDRPVSPMEPKPSTPPAYSIPPQHASEMIAPVGPPRAELPYASPGSQMLSLGGRSDVPIQELPLTQYSQSPYAQRGQYQPAGQSPSPHSSPAPFQAEVPGSGPASPSNGLVGRQPPGGNPPGGWSGNGPNVAGPFEMSGQRG